MTVSINNRNRFYADELNQDFLDLACNLVDHDDEDKNEDGSLGDFCDIRMVVLKDGLLDEIDGQFNMPETAYASPTTVTNLVNLIRPKSRIPMLGYHQTVETRIAGHFEVHLLSERIVRERF